MLKYNTGQIVTMMKKCEEIGINFDYFIVDMERLDDECAERNIYFDGETAYRMIYNVSAHWEHLKYNDVFDNFYTWLSIYKRILELTKEGFLPPTIINSEVEKLMRQRSRNKYLKLWVEIGTVDKHSGQD